MVNPRGRGGGEQRDFCNFREILGGKPYDEPPSGSFENKREKRAGRAFLMQGQKK